MSLISVLVTGGVGVVGVPVLYAAGLLVLRGCARTSWWTAITLAPPVSAGVAAFATLAGPTTLTWCVLVALLTAVAVSTRYRRGPVPPGKQTRTVVLGTVAVVLAACWRAWPTLADIPPDGRGLAATLDALTPYAAGGGTAVGPLTAVPFLVTAVAVPAGVAALARLTLPRLPLAAPVAAALVVLAPLPSATTALALAPATVALVLRTQRQGWPPLGCAVSALAVAGLGSGGGTAVAGAAVLVGAAVLETLIRRRHRALSRPLEAARIAGCAALCLVALLPWAPWTSWAGGVPYTATGMSGALRELALLDGGRDGSGPLSTTLLATALGWTGLVLLAVRARTWWPLLTAGAFGGLFVLTVGAGWPGDPARLLPLVVLLVALGIGAATGAALRLLTAPTVRPTPALAALLVVVWGLVGGALWYGSQSTAPHDEAVRPPGRAAR